MRSLRGPLAVLRRAATLTLASGVLQAVAAQRPELHRPGRIPVTVAVTDHGFRGQDAVILRQYADGIPNLVVLSRHAPPRALADAALALVMLMERDGDVARTQAIVAPAEAVGTPRREIGAAARVLTRIHASPTVVIAGLGEARISSMYLPGQRMRTALRQRSKLTLHQVGH